ncbi:iron-sulfur cluster-binding domain-containing protein [Flavobacteriales bacterium]|nr:iron-sulfur cluster-binding domain-containing protein [Flavobacteriales bacterium]
MNHSNETPPSLVPWTPDLVPCKVQDVRRMTPQSVVVTLDPGSAMPRFRHTPGQRVTFCLDINGSLCFRSYNLINAQGDLPQIAVKQVAQGGCSQMMNERLQPGDMLNVAPPTGHLYDLSLDHKAHHILLFAAGSGITPLFSVAQHALRARPDHRVTLIYANSTARSIMMQQALDRMAHSKRFEVFHVLGDGATGEDLSTGRLDHDKLNRLMEQYRSKDLPEAAFQSGPHGFMHLIQEAASNQDRPFAVKRYSFAEQPFVHPAESRTEDKQAEVTITVNGVTHTLPSVSRSMTLLEAADEAGIAMTANCKSGICHRCKAKLVSGQTFQSPPINSGRRPENGWILCCQERPGSNKVEIEVG